MQQPRHRSIHQQQQPPIHYNNADNHSMSNDNNNTNNSDPLASGSEIELTEHKPAALASSFIMSFLTKSTATAASSSSSSTSLVSNSPGTPHGSPWIRKPLSVVHRQESSSSSRPNTPVVLNSEQRLYQQPQQGQNSTTKKATPATNTSLHRHLSVWDLIGIGVGGTVGSGIFVLTGAIAANYAGPATAISMAIAGIAATCSGVCYAELSARIPAAGSTYVYAYVCWGEVAAVVAAACLTLEYGIAGAAVARTWGDKVIEWMQSMNPSDNNDHDVSSWLLPFDGAMNVPACFVSAASTLLLLLGVSESKAVMNWITTIKMMIVIFMIVGGFCLYDSRNMPPATAWAPYGVTGVLRGSTTSFFGFLGYDEVCCVAGEAKHPVRDMPRAVLGTLMIVTICYIFAAIALTGMLPYDEISPTSGFPAAFASRGVNWAAQLTAAGEVGTLPVVVLISLLAQPRLTYSMAQDGLLPRIFAKVDASGNLIGGTAISGILMTLIASFVPFTYLDDLISAGILVAFSMTNTCLVLLRCKASPTTTNHNNHNPWILELLLLLYNALCFITAILWTHSLLGHALQTTLAIFTTALTVVCFLYLYSACPQTPYFGGTILSQGETDRHVPSNPDTPVADHMYFATPAVPFLPCMGMAVNWYLIAQLDQTGILLLCLYLAITIALYGVACAPNSVGHLRNWSDTYESIREAEVLHDDDEEEHFPPPPPKAYNHDDDDEYDDDDDDEIRAAKAARAKLTRTSSF